MLLLEESVGEDIDAAYAVLHDIIHDTEIPNNQIKRGAAESIIALHRHFYQKRKGVAEPTIEEMDAQKTSVKIKEKPLLRLTMTGT